MLAKWQNSRRRLVLQVLLGVTLAGRHLQPEVIRAIWRSWSALHRSPR